MQLQSSLTDIERRLLTCPPAADQVPSERQRTVPPLSEIAALRAPALEASFAEYRAQLAGPAAEGACCASAALS